MPTSQRGLTREDDFENAVEALPSDFELKWVRGLTEEQIREKLSPIPEIIENASEGILTGLAVLQGVVDLLSSAVDLLALVLRISVDVLQGVYILVNEILEQLIELLQGTSLSFLYHFPTSPKARRRPNEILYDIGMSYLDKEDSNRPILNKDGHGAVVVGIWSLPDLNALMEVFDNILKKFRGFDGLSDDLSGLGELNDPFTDLEFRVEGGGSGMAPDWGKTYALSDIPIFKKLLYGLTETLLQLSTLKGFFDKINEIIRTVNLRISRITELATQLISTIASLIDFFTFGSPLALFICAGKGDSEDFGRAVINAPLHPSYPKSETYEKDILLKSTGENILNTSRQLGQEYSFGGGVAMHIQAGVDVEFSRIQTIIDMIAGEDLKEDLEGGTGRTQENFNKFVEIRRGKTQWTQREE